MKTTILIADDHPLFREALTYIVESSINNMAKENAFENTDVDIIHSTDYLETLDIIARKKINWLFLDLNMPDSNGLSGMVNIRKAHPDIPIVVISANQSTDIVKSCLNQQVRGYITKSTLPEDIEKAIQLIFSGEVYSPLMNDSGENNESEKKQHHNQQLGGIETLTAAQLNILGHIGLGKLNKQIAIDLGITEATVKAHITQIYKKLKINNRTQAALLAKQSQLIDG